ncbi:MAG: LCP family protein [Actinomycetota bacterium]
MAHGATSRKTWNGPWRRRALTVACALSALIAVGSGYAFGYLVYLQVSVDHVEGLDLDDTVPDQPQNILILGSDSRAGLPPEEQEIKGSEDDVPGQRADTIILLRVDPKTGKSTVVHFPRDLRVPISPSGELGKLNTAFEGGAEAMKDTIQDFSGLRIHHYIEVDFSGFQKIVDAMGGVEICVDRPMVDVDAELNLPAAGCYLLGGKGALAFVRARSVDGDLIPDFARIARQQQFLRAVLNKALSPGSIFSLPSLAKAVIDNLAVDEGISVIEINDISRRLRSLGTPDIDFRVVPSVHILLDGISYLEPTDQAAGLFERLRDGRPLGRYGLGLERYTRQFALISVRILDGGGDATTVRTRLSAGGFEVLPTIDAPAGATATRVLFRPGREADAAAVAEFLSSLFTFETAPPIEEASPESIGGADIGIVVGTDFGEPVNA